MKDNLEANIGKAALSGKYDDMTISELLKLFNEDKTRKIQYYKDNQDSIWTYFIKGESNPCGCGSNCYHHEYDGRILTCVCNACNTDIYEVKEEYIEDELRNGIWK